MKAPGVDVSDFILQPRKYASWIHSYCNDDFHIDRFYVYLIGDSFDFMDVRASDSRFVVSSAFEYAFCPETPVIDLEEKRNDGSLYMEIISYTSVLERAIKRNDAFFDNLFEEKKDSEGSKLDGKC